MALISAYQKYLKVAKKIKLPQKQILDEDDFYMTKNVWKLSPHEIALRQSENNVSRKVNNAAVRAFQKDEQRWQNFLKENGLSEDIKLTRKNVTKYNGQQFLKDMSSDYYQELQLTYADDLASGLLTLKDLSHMISVEIFGSPE